MAQHGLPVALVVRRVLCAKCHRTVAGVTAALSSSSGDMCHVLVWPVLDSRLTTVVVGKAVQSYHVSSCAYVRRLLHMYFAAPLEPNAVEPKSGNLTELLHDHGASNGSRAVSIWRVCAFILQGQGDELFVPQWCMQPMLRLVLHL